MPTIDDPETPEPNKRKKKIWLILSGLIVAVPAVLAQAGVLPPVANDLAQLLAGLLQN